MTKIYTQAEIAAFNATHTPARKTLAAQAKWTPRPGREAMPYGEFPSRTPRGETMADAAERKLEHDMLHGQDS
jgi:hypothetical protein